ncbi:MAG: RecB family exonuclease [Gemmataceae bacterium]
MNDANYPRHWPGTANLDHLSYSKIALYRQCPLRFQFRYIHRLPEEMIPSSLLFGSAFHASLEEYFQHFMIHGQSPGLDQLQQVFWDRWHREPASRIAFNRDESVVTVACMVEVMLRAFLASDLAAPTGTIIGIEEEITGSIVPGCPDLLARLDLVIDAGDAMQLIDFKTARRPWNSETVSQSAAQLHLYGQVGRSLADGKPLRLQFAVLTKAKRSPKVSLHTVANDVCAVSETLRMVARTWDAIRSGEFPANPSPIYCPRCPYRQRCPAWNHRSF